MPVDPEVIKLAVDKHARSRLTDRTAARKIYESLSLDQRAWVAIEHLAEMVWTARRLTQIRIENAAVDLPTLAPPVHGDSVEFQRVFDDPLCLYSTTDRPGWVHFNVRDRRAFRRWCKDRFEDWYERARIAITSSPSRYTEPFDMFESDWYPEGSAAYYRERRYGQILELVEEYGRQVRLEVTEELLGSDFALGDGQRVSWGRATLAQHRQRIAIQASHGLSVIEDAGRHAAAIRMIEEAGVSCLGELRGRIGAIA